MVLEFHELKKLNMVLPIKKKKKLNIVQLSDLHPYKMKNFLILRVNC